MAYFSSSLNVNRPLLLSLLIMKIKAGAAAFFKKNRPCGMGERVMGIGTFPLSHEEV